MHDINVQSLILQKINGQLHSTSISFPPFLQNHRKLDRGYPNGTNTPRGDNFSRYQNLQEQEKV